MPSVTVLHTDVIGTTYVDSSFDYRKLKAVRKIIIKWDGDGDAANNDELIAALKTSSGVSPNMDTPLGPLWKDGDTQTAGNAVVHPSNNFLPLQTVEITKMGDQRFLVTASYFIVPGTTGGALNVPQTCSMRAETAAIRLLKSYVPGGGGTPVDLVPETFSCGDGSAYQFGVVATIAVVKIRVPFYASRNPITTSGGILNFLGGRNARTTLGGIDWGENALRFDGVTMDEMGGFVSDGANTYKFKGFYEFTARQDQFAEHVYNCSTGTIETHYPSIEIRNDGWTASSFNI